MTLEGGGQSQLTPSLPLTSPQACYIEAGATLRTEDQLRHRRDNQRL